MFNLSTSVVGSVNVMTSDKGGLSNEQVADLAVDKIVALSPSQWDDLIWTSIKKALYKVVGK